MEGVGVSMTENELWFLFSQVSPTTIIGFHNPMLGLLSSEIEISTQEAILSLTKKQLISFDDDSNLIEIDKCLQNSISTIASAQHSVLIAYQENNSKNKKILSFHFNNHHSVLLKLLEDGAYSLLDNLSMEQLISLATKPLKNNIFWAPDSAPLYFKESCLKNIQELLFAGNVEDAKNQMMELTGEQKTKLQLVEALDNPQINMSFIGFYQRKNTNTRYVDGLSILAGNRYLWALELVDEKSKLIRASKVSLKELERKIELKIPQMEKSQSEI